MRTFMVRLAAGFCAIVAGTMSASVWAAAPQETVLHSFCSLTGCADGGGSVSGLVADRAGNLYGTTGGGAYGYGGVFKVTPNGTETILYSFTGAADGGFPDTALIIDRAGNLYGTTEGGAYGYGNVFKITRAGEETVLYSFTGGADGSGPTGTLTTGRAGDFYGTTAGGGAYGNGTVFKLSPSGAETVLFSFPGPYAGAPLGVITDSVGSLYGTVDNAVFKLTPAGAETVLYTFCTSSIRCLDGDSPRARRRCFMPLPAAPMEAFRMLPWSPTVQDTSSVQPTGRRQRSRHGI